MDGCAGRYQREVLKQGEKKPAFEFIANYPGWNHDDAEPGQGSIAQENKAIRVEATRYGYVERALRQLEAPSVFPRSGSEGEATMRFEFAGMCGRAVPLEVCGTGANQRATHGDLTGD